MNEKLLTREEVARYLGVTERQVNKFVSKGMLTAYKVGGTFIRFRSEQVEAVRKAIPSFSARAKDMPQPSVNEKLLDFLYFNDFYIIAGLIAISLIIIILFF